MRFTKILSSVITAAFIVSAAAQYPGNITASETVTISPYSHSSINNGVFEGWGTSLCWWANRIGYSDSLSEQAAQMFFGDSGLRMNIARFNIGGGDDPSHDHITRTDSNMPGYTVYNNGNVTYDWSKDANQRNVLIKSIKSCSSGLIVEMFSNSPPYYMTKSGCSTGGTDPNQNNLRDDCYDDFADYLATVCKHYEDTWGVKIQSVEPMNEPYTNYWSAYSKKQEGCHFDIGNSESKMITSLSSALSKHGLSDIMLSGTDETGIDVQIDAFNALSDEAKNLLSRIDTHTYGGSKRTELRDTALSSNKNLWMSEVDGAGTAGTNAGQMSSALWLSQRMITDCNGLDCSAWILWQAIDKHICAAGLNGKADSGMPDTNGGFWGLAVADHDSNNIITTKKYYAFGQFSRYIRPGSVILRSSDKTMAAYDEKNNQLVIVALNTSGSSQNISFDLSQFNSIGSSAKAIRTSGDITNGENWAELSPVKTDGSGFNATLKENSVTTYIIDDVRSTDIPDNEISIGPDQVTGSAPWNNTANDCKKAVDGNLSSFFDGVGSGWLMIDLKESYNIDAIAFAPRSGYEYRCTDGEFSGSADSISWQKLYTVPHTPVSGLNFITDLPVTDKIRYIRYQVPDGPPQTSENKDSVYCCNIAEIKVYGDPSDRIIKGDINNDGSVTVMDILMMTDFLLGKSGFDDEQFIRADISANGSADIIDLCMLKNIILDI